MSEPVLVLEHVLAERATAAAHVVVHPGQVALLFGRGRYGALMECVLGQQQPREGAITLLGCELSGASEQARRALRARCGVLPERVSLLSHLSVSDNVALPVRYHRPDDLEGLDGRVSALLAFWGLAPIAGVRPPLDVFTSIRVALVRCLVSRAELVVLENPFERVDDEQRREVDRLIEALTHQGAGILVIDA